MDHEESNDRAQLAGTIDLIVAARVTLEQLRQGLEPRDPAGRYLSLAITELEQAAHWLADAKRLTP